MTTTVPERAYLEREGSDMDTWRMTTAEKGFWPIGVTLFSFPCHASFFLFFFASVLTVSIPLYFLLSSPSPFLLLLRSRIGAGGPIFICHLTYVPKGHSKYMFRERTEGDGGDMTPVGKGQRPNRIPGCTVLDSTQIFFSAQGPGNLAVWLHQGRPASAGTPWNRRRSWQNLHHSTNAAIHIFRRGRRCTAVLIAREDFGVVLYHSPQSRPFTKSSPYKNKDDFNENWDVNWRKLQRRRLNEICVIQGFWLHLQWGRWPYTVAGDTLGRKRVV